MASLTVTGGETTKKTPTDITQGYAKKGKNEVKGTMESYGQRHQTMISKKVPSTFVPVSFQNYSRQ